MTRMWNYLWIVLPLSLWLLGCPIVEGPGRSLESGCSICPPQTTCYSTQLEDGTVTVSCLPAETSEEDVEIDPDSLFVEADTGALSCSEWSCPCLADEDCSSTHCMAFEGSTVCSLPCPEICLEEECADACPANGTCTLADDDSAACRPLGLSD